MDAGLSLWARYWSLPVLEVNLLLFANLFGALLLGLPAQATLAAFALPTLRRSISALIDWFTLLFFSASAIAIWVIWLSVQTGVPCGVALTDAADADEIGVQAFGGADRTLVVIASAAISAGAIVIADSTKVKTLPTAGGTYYIVGQALTAADADGDRLEIAPCPPVKIVVT